MKSVTITEIRNAKAFNPENTWFDVEIKHPEFGWIPYLLSPNDPDQTINNDNLRSMIGDNFSPYVAPTQSELDAAEAQNVRAVRDFKLEQEVDPIAGNTLRWNSLTDAQRAAWTQYRIDLLDISNQAGFPYNVTWPTKPS